MGKSEIGSKRADEVKVNGQAMSVETIKVFLEKDINTVMQILYTIREDDRLKTVMAEVLKEKFDQKSN